MDADDLYGDLYGEEPTAQPQVAVDPRKRAAPAPVAPAPQSTFTPLTGSFRAVPAGGSSYIPAVYSAQAAAQQAAQQGAGPSSYAQPPAGARQINSYHDSAEYRAPQRVSSDYEDGKMFIGGLSWETTEDTLTEYFGQYGAVVSCSVMRDQSNGRSRGFAFLSFKDSSSVNVVMAHTHFVDGKQVDPKRAVPPPNKKAQFEEPRTEKLFVRSVAPEVTQAAFQAYFTKFGPYQSATLMVDRETGQNRGYGFVDFDSPDSVDAVLASMPHYIDGHLVDTKKSHPKPRRDGQPGPPGAPAMPDNPSMQSFAQPMQASVPLAATSTPPQPMMTGPFNAQTIAQYFRKITGGDVSKLAGFDPQKMFAEIAASNPAPAARPVQSYADAPRAPQPHGLQSIGTFQSDEPPPMRKSAAHFAGFEDSYDMQQPYVAPPENAPRGPRGTSDSRYRPY